MPEKKARSHERANRIGSAAMPETPRFPIRMEPALRAVIEAESERAGINMTEWLRQAIFFRLAYLATARGETDKAESLVRRFANGDGD